MLEIVLNNEAKAKVSRIDLVHNGLDYDESKSIIDFCSEEEIVPVTSDYRA